MLISRQLKVKHAVVLIWVPTGVDFGKVESDACSGVDVGTNWCCNPGQLKVDHAGVDVGTNWY
jgi:hypothetical protein